MRTAGRVAVPVALALLVLGVLTGVALGAFPASAPNDPEYAPAEDGGPGSCLNQNADAQQHYLFGFIPDCATNASDPTGAAYMNPSRLHARRGPAW